MTRREWAAQSAFARPPIRLRLLGAVDLCDHEGRPLEAILAQPRRLGLLAYLAMASRHGFVRRDQAIALFWPEHDSEHARAALTRAIYYLRQSLGDGVLVGRGSDEIHLAADTFWCDAVALDAAIAEGRAEDALALYRGELLEGFFVSNAPGFERWVDAERRRLADTACRAAWSIADGAERSGNHAMAARWCRWAVDRSPLDEAGVQRLMTALDHAGDRAGAVLVYEQFAERVASELDLSPSPETRALHDGIRRRAANGPEKSLATMESEALTGREGDERAVPTIADRQGPPRASVVRRPPGDWWKRRITGVAIAAIALVATGVSVVMTTSPSSRDPRRVAVASLSGTVGDRTLDSLSERANGVIRDALARTGVIAVALPVAGPRAGAATSIRAIADETRAALVVVTSLRKDGTTLALGARIVDALGGQVRWVIPSVRATTATLEPATDAIAQRTAGGIAALGDRRFASWLPGATSPPTLRAYEEFDRATDLKLRNRPADAMIHFERAAALDSTFTWSLMEAVITHMNVGDYVGADSIVDLLATDRDRLSVVQRHWLDWMLALRDEDWTRSYAALERAARLAPDRFLYGLAENARWLNLPRRSIEVLDRLGPDNAFAQGFGYWYLMADAYHQLRDHVRELDVAQRGRQRQPDRLTAVIVEAKARAALGDVAGVLALADVVLTFPREGRDTPGTMMVQCAEELRAHGHRDASRALLDRAITWFRDRPANEARSMAVRREFARAAYDAEQWTEAEVLFRQLALDDRDGSIFYRALIGAIAAHRGDTADARSVVDTLRELTRSAKRPRQDVLFGQARILAILGDRAESVRLLREALGGQGQDLHTEADFESLIPDPAFQLLVRPKG